MPTTANKLYSSGRFNGVSRRWKSDEYNLFLSEAASFEMRNRQLIEDAAAFAQAVVDRGELLEIQSFFVFEPGDLWTKPTTSKRKSFPKQLDSSNRIKACHDVLAKMLNIDDRYFWSGYFEKCEGPKQNVTIIIRAIKARNINEITQHASTAKTCPDQTA